LNHGSSAIVWLKAQAVGQITFPATPALGRLGAYLTVLRGEPRYDCGREMSLGKGKRQGQSNSYIAKERIDIWTFW